MHIEEIKRGYEAKIVKLQEQNAALKLKVEESNALSSEKIEPKDYTLRFDELEERNAKVVRDTNGEVVAQMKQVLSTLKDTEELQKEAHSLHVRLEKQQEESAVMRHQLDAAASELAIEKATTAEMSRHVKDLKDRQALLIQQADTMVSRFESGDLV